MAVNGNGLRRLVKTGVAVSAHWSRLDRVLGARRGFDQAPLVLGYHRVVEDFESSARSTMPSMLVSTQTLEKHLDWVGRRYSFVSMDELAQLQSAGPDGMLTTPGEKPVAVVTFDDGYRDVHEHAFPLLQRKGIPFIAYVVTDLVGTDRLQLHDELFLLLSNVLDLDPGPRAELWKTLADGFEGDPVRIEHLLRQVDDSGTPYLATRLMLHGLDALEVRRALGILRSNLTLDRDQVEAFLSMDWDMLREMVRGVGAVGSHTRSHALLATESEAVVREELEGSRRDLERKLDVPIRHFAYPDGSFNEKTLRAVDRAGYVTACTACGHRNPLFPTLTIPRRMLWEGACLDALGQFSPAILSCQINGVFDAVERCPYEH